MVKPIERVLRSGLFGPWDDPTSRASTLPEGINPANCHSLGQRQLRVLPEHDAAVLGAGLVPDLPLLAHRGRTSTSSRPSLYFVPAKTARERLAQELAAVTFKEYALQDANTLEATQTMLATRTVTEFPLCDQEILLRHLHKVVEDYVRSTKMPAAN